MHFYQVIFVLVHVLLVEGNRFTIYYATPHNCDYRGYAPGGKVKGVDKIEAPTAKMAKRGLASVLGPVSQASTLTMHSVNTVKAVVQAFKTVAPALGPALGVFGAATGIFKAMTAPKPKDILRAVNGALSKLTKDINDKLEQMEGYVNSEIVRVEKNLISRDYQSAFLLWKNCVREATFELSQECQREAYSTISANRPKFAIYASKLKNKVDLKGYEGRELEAYLVAFRNYASLILMMLKPLVETYGKDNSTVGKSNYDRYTTDLQDQAEFFIEYAQDAVEAILKMHKGTQNAGICPTSVDCGRFDEVEEGDIFPKHTADETSCTCIIEAGNKQLCRLGITIRYDGKYPSGYGTYNYPCSSLSCAAREYTRRRLLPVAQAFQKKNLKIAKAYWEKELLDFVPVWQEAIQIAKTNVRGDVPNGERDDKDKSASKDTFSPRYAARLQAAQKMARKLQKKVEKKKKSG